MKKVLMKIAATVSLLIAAFLVYAVVHAVGSAGGANVPVCIGYVAGALLLGAVAVMMWRRSQPRTH